MTAKLQAPLLRNRTDLESHNSMTSEGELLVRELRIEMMQLQASAVPPGPTRNSVIQHWRFWMCRQEAQIKNQKAEIKKSSTKFRINAGLSEQLGWCEPQFGPRCLCWWQYWYIDFICKPSHGTNNQSPTTSRGPRVVPTKNALKCRKQHHNWLQLRVHHQRATRKLNCQYNNSSIPSTFKRTQEDPDRELQETSYHSRRKSSIREEITYRQTDCLDDLRLLQYMRRQWSHLELQRRIESSFARTTTFKPSTQSGIKDFQQ